VCKRRICHASHRSKAPLYAFRAVTPPLPHPPHQALSYAWFLPTYYNQSWFGGVLFWTWRADPTVGGTADDGITPTGKGAQTLLKQWWG
jgi:hypothetical protein